MARGDANDLATLRSRPGVTPAQLASQRSATVRDAAITDALAGAAVATAAIALYVTLRTDEARRKHKAVQLQIAPGGVAIAGRF